MKLRIFLVLIALFVSCTVYAQDSLRDKFLNNRAVICSINIRNFNAQDTNGNGIIDEDEVSGNFINAVERLDEIEKLGINTLHVLPITPVGKLKALGTAGSLYAISDFTSVNPQLVDLMSSMTPQEQVKYFVEECHKRGIKVIFDLPSCGSYDLFLTHPEYFIKDKKNLSIVPTDWTDVRLFNTGDNMHLNQDLLDVHKAFVDMVLDFGADGIRADVATIKPYEFWYEIIKYTRARKPDFLFLAEASDSWREPPSKYAEFTPYNELLQVGFDGYYGSFFNLKDWKSSKEFNEHIKFNTKLLNSYKDKKSVILSFTTHDEVSPVVLRGEDFSVMISWLEATLPFNPYFVDGFQSGDKYLYPWANTKAQMTETDDDYYFAHRGQLDIFNYSRRPQGQSKLVEDNFRKAFRYRQEYETLISDGEYIQLKSDKDSVIAYMRSYNNDRVVVVANIDDKKVQRNIKIKINGLKKTDTLSVIHGNANYRVKKNKLITDLEPNQIKVLRVNNFEL